MSLYQILNKIKSNFVLVGIVILLVGFAFFSYARFYIKPVYQASSVIVVVKSGSTTNGSMTYQDVLMSTKLADTYSHILTDDNMMQKLISKYHLKLSIRDLKQNIKIQQIDDTELLKISVITQNPELSFHISNTIADLAPDEIQSLYSDSIVKTIEKAILPSSPYKPDTNLYTLIGLLFGLIISIFVCAILVYFDRTIKSENDVKKQLGLTCLAALPLYKKMSWTHTAAKTANHRAVFDTLPFELKEAYKTLKTNIQFSNTDYKYKSIIVTSPNPNEGKSSVAINLALSLAQAGFKVLLVDADLRKPSVFRYLNIKDKPGLTDILVNDFNTDPISKCRLIKVGNTSLSVLTHGTIPSNALELISSQKMNNVVKTMENTFDYIIYDTPPLLLVSDALALSKFTGHVLLVISSCYTEEEAALTAVESVQNMGTDIIGCVLNNVGSEYISKGYYKKSYYKKYNN